MLFKGIYLATHFENAYQTWDIEDVVRYVREIAEMDANTIGFWFDQHEYRSSDLRKEGSLARTRWRRLCRISQAAHDAGMKVMLCTIANEAYLDQVKPEIRADTRGRSGKSCFPTQLCVSRDEAADICIANVTELVGTIPYVDYLVTTPYDQGGCDCLECAPWSRTYIRLSKRIFDAAKERKPDLEPILSAWGMNESDVRDLLIEAHSIFPDGITLFFNQDSRLPEHGIDARQIKSLRYSENARLIGFPEISMLFDGDGEIPTMWGIFGANPVPRYLARRFRDQQEYVAGMVAYSEGIYEDFNKWVILQLGAHPDLYLDDIVAGYAKRYLSSAVARDFVQLIHRLEDNWKHKGPHFDAVVNMSLARLIESRLPDQVRAGWRWRILYLRCRLDEIVARGREKGKERIAEELEHVLGQVKKLYRCAEFLHPVITPAQVSDAALGEN
jgi:hypothetical protein